jgi:rubrerythrin
MSSEIWFWHCRECKECGFLRASAFCKSGETWKNQSKPDRCPRCKHSRFSYRAVIGEGSIWSIEEEFE